MEEQTRTSGDLAEAIGYSCQRLNQMLRAGKIVGKKLNGIWYIPQSEFDKWVAVSKSRKTNQIFASRMFK